MFNVKWSHEVYIADIKHHLLFWCYVTSSKNDIIGGTTDAF